MTGRRRIAVLAWDVGHNPLGRAHTLATVLRRHFDVEIWGAQFARYGTGTWPPLRGDDIPVHTFPGHDLPAHLAVMEEVAARIDADAVWVSKPRFPSLGLGALVKEDRNRPLVLDVDDLELAFFEDAEGLDLARLGRTRRRARNLALPAGRAWTQACEAAVAGADAITTSSSTLATRYGGVVVPHARDEVVFDPDRYDRDRTRADLGILPNQRLLLFGGTPRAHKGLPALLRAVDRLGDPRCRVGVFDTRELDAVQRAAGDLARWLHPIPPPRFADLAPVVGAADISCVLQDRSSRVAQWQMPAKVTDALAMEVPCLATHTPPLRPLIDREILHVDDGRTPLHELIAGVLDGGDEVRERAARGRQLFLNELSVAAVSGPAAAVFEALLPDPPPTGAPLRALLDAARRVHPDRSVPTPRVPRRSLAEARPIQPASLFDLAIFWKQNDTSIYGRRQDMLLQHLEASGRFAAIVHFDHPVTPEALVLLAGRTVRGGRADQSRLVLGQTLRRVLHRRDQGRVRHRTFVYAGRVTGRLGLRSRASYPDHVAAILARAGFGDHPTIFWTYPPDQDFPAIVDALQPDLVVADVVDDGRTWHPEGSHLREEVDHNLAEVLARSDLVLANAEPVAERVRALAPDVHVVPNAADDPAPVSACPPELRRLPRPIVGYVGNLSSRLDLPLLDAIARARPEWTFVFAGSAHLDQSILVLDELPNVHFLGVLPYDRARRLVQHLDVAIIPHLDDEMTRSMHPLKTFVYLAEGVPVVSTPIANLGDLAGLVTIADGPDAFVRAISVALSRPVPHDARRLAEHTWVRRVDQILALIDAASSGGAPGRPSPDVGVG